MASQALYRKYRSATFEELIGQEHITRTLMASLAAGQSSHAYLFVGPRGVGKTSAARLLARALNCTKQGKTVPCNVCSNCQADINSTLDIIEIDAASNNGVDDVRALREKVNIAPTTGTYKVYIIDEVHMLSSGAFNALLKTLEEPPAHAVFIMATTEAHKVPATILSRTQSFSFRPISEADITSHLLTIAKAESIKLAPEAAAMIARTAAGGFRDAISMLDQLRSNGDVNTTLVREVLGLADEELLTSVSRAVASGDAAGALESLDALLATGVQPGQAATQLVELWRAVMRRAVAGKLASETDLAALVAPARCAVIIEAFMGAVRSSWPQASLETALVRLSASDVAPAPHGTVSHLAPAPAKPRTAKKPASSEPITEISTDGAPDGALDAGRWPKVLVGLKQHNSSLCALLGMYPTDFSGDTVTVRSRFNFHRDLFNKPQNRQAIEAVAARVYGRAVTVTAITDESAAAPKRKKSNDASDDLAAAALEILGGEVID